MGLNIKKAIKEHGLTSKEVAERMGMTAINLSYHINGNPTVGVLQRIADAIGCDIIELFDRKETTAVCPHCGKEIKIKVEIHA